MRCPTTINTVNSLFLTMTPSLAVREASSSQARPYTDIDTGITFYGHVLPTGYRFGMTLPQKPTTDFIMQLVSPLQDGTGWGGIALGGSMLGPLMLVTWPDSDKVMTSPYIARDYTPSGTTPYTANPIDILPIKKGTFVNSTHISSTFLCAGCINEDSFSPDSNGDVYLASAYSQTAVEDPSNPKTTLSDHTSPGSGYATFSATFSKAKSDEYDTYAALARPRGPTAEDPDYPLSPGSGGMPTSTSSSATVTGMPEPTSTGESSEATPTPTDQGGMDDGGEPEDEMLPGPDSSRRQMSPWGIFGLVMVGVVYLVQPFLTG